MRDQQQIMSYKFRAIASDITDPTGASYAMRTETRLAAAKLTTNRKSNELAAVILY
jgi:hypothetical protein